MKKIALLMLLVLTFTFFGCANNNSEESLESLVINTSGNTDSFESSNVNEAKIKELENEIDRLNLLLSGANNENKDLLKQILDLKEIIEDPSSSVVSQEKIYLKGRAYLLLKEYLTAPYYSLSIVNKTDNTEVEIIKLNYFWALRASPDRTKVIFNDFQAEYTAHVYMYDMEKRETKELLMPDLPEYRTVTNMEWLDDRYFLFVVQYNTGLVVRGGDVYVYDTKTDEYKAIIKSEDYSKFQTEKLDVYSEDFVIFYSWLGDGTANFIENKYHILSYDEIYDLINNNKTIDLIEEDALN